MGGGERGGGGGGRDGGSRGGGSGGGIGVAGGSGLGGCGDCEERLKQRGFRHRQMGDTTTDLRPCNGWGIDRPTHCTGQKVADRDHMQTIASWRQLRRARRHMSVHPPLSEGPESGLVDSRRGVFSPVLHNPLPHDIS